MNLLYVYILDFDVVSLRYSFFKTTPERYERHTDNTLIYFVYCDLMYYSSFKILTLLQFALSYIIVQLVRYFNQLL